MFEHKLKKPVEYNGETIEKLEFDFDKLTGADCMAIEDELQAIGKPAVIPAFSSPFLVRMATKACTIDIGSDIFDYMGISDFNIIKSQARSFLLGTE